jgi:hypothetical protein
MFEVLSIKGSLIKSSWLALEMHHHHLLITMVDPLIMNPDYFVAPHSQVQGNLTDIKIVGSLKNTQNMRIF